MEFSGTFEIDEPADELCDYFPDPDIVADAAPGISEMTLEDPAH